jgi:DNA-binding CsgD family transcriptional regulator
MLLSHSILTISICIDGGFIDMKQTDSILTREALVLLSQGLLREQIAAQMCITLGSVRNLIQIVRRKLDVETSIQAVVWAWANGLMHQ